jgi:adenylate kinase
MPANNRRALPTRQGMRHFSQYRRSASAGKAEGGSMRLLRDRTAWLQGEPLRCLQPPAASPAARRFVLLGPPGVGKATQSEMLATILGACPLSTADIFRAGVERSPAPGSAIAAAAEHMNRGELVPDDIVLGLIRNRRGCLRCRGGFLLDGFPRTLPQAVALDGLLEIERLPLDAALCYELAFPILVARMAGRRVCRRCHARFNLASRPPLREGRCDHCCGPLEQRPDDAPPAVAARLAAYAHATAQVADFYERKRLLVRIDATGSPERILLRTLEALAALGFDVPSPAAFPAAATTAPD